MTSTAPVARDQYWSQAFATDIYHAIPRDGHDPNASGWIARCGALCCGTPKPARPTSFVCRTCIVP